MISAVSVRQVAIRVGGRRLLDGVSFDVAQGECLAIMGSSGSGKTSLLHCLAGIKTEHRGTIVVHDQEVGRLSRAARAQLRLNKIGMVFQFGELLPELTVEENVAIPARLAGANVTAARSRAEALLASFELEHLKACYPRTLSGGEVQRTAIARALCNQPSVVLADEPTGALDERASLNVMKVLISAARSEGSAVVIATHDPLVAVHADRVLQVCNGRLENAERPVAAP